MSKIKVLVDSNSMLTDEVMAKYDITKIYNVVSMDGQEYEDGRNLSIDMFYEQMRKGSQPTTAQPNYGKIVEAYETFCKEYDHVIFFLIADGLSGSYGTAISAIEVAGVDNVTVVNSESVCYVEGEMALATVRMIQKGEALETILEMLQVMKDNTNTYLIPYDLHHLKRGGRVSTAAAVLGSMLKIKPVLKFENKGSVIDKFAVARTEKKGFDIIVEDIEANIDSSKQYKYIVLHADSVESGMKLKQVVDAKFGVDSQFDLMAPVIAAHTGVGCVGVQYVMVDDHE